MYLSRSQINQKHARCIIKNHKDLFEAIILYKAQNNKLYDNRDNALFGNFLSCKNHLLSPRYRSKMNEKTLIDENFHKELYKIHPFDTSKFVFPDEIKKVEYQELLGIAGKCTKAAKK